MRLSINSHTKRVIAIISCAVLSTLFIVVLFFCAPKISAVPETTGEVAYEASKLLSDGTYSTENATAIIGKDFTAIRISDLTDLNKITKVNYVADKFVRPNTLSPDIQIVDLTKPFDFAPKGTLIFIIMNLDPNADDFHENKKALSKYMLGDYWHFTLSLPKIFCASNVYQKVNLIARHGEIEDYDFIDYTSSYTKKTEKLQSATEKTLIDLDFYTRRETMDRAFASAQVITIHYQSTGSAYSGIADAPLIGTESAVKTMCDISQNLLIAFSILAAVVFVVFIVLSVLEHSKEFVSPIIWVFGIFIMLLSRFLLSGVSSAPLLWVAMSLASSFIILCGALNSMGRNFGKLPAKYIAVSLSTAGAVLAFVRPFVSFGTASALSTVCAVIKGICAVTLMLFIVLATLKKEDKDNGLPSICSTLIAVSIFISIFLPQVFPAQYNPMYWMCVITTMVTFISVFAVFMNIKKSNVYLTDNLHKEIERQLKDIKAIISERDRLLQFVSHDMRKPLNSSVALLGTAIERENNVEQIKTLQIIKQNDSRVLNNLSEIAAYAKFNYIS